MGIVNIVGGGLAGTEAAWQCLKKGHDVRLFEMRPGKMTEAHKTSGLAELVCSNTFKSDRPGTPAGQLKYEMASLDSLVISGAYHSRVPAGQALGVDRVLFSQYLEKKLYSEPRFQRISAEVVDLPAREKLRGEVWIVATGPLTSAAMAEQLTLLAGEDKFLHFYDAIAPIFDTDSIDMSMCYWASRYDENEGDYLNIPLDESEYLAFVSAIAAAEKTPLHHFESTSYFESCLPIEVMVERGFDTPRFARLSQLV